MSASCGVDDGAVSYLSGSRESNLSGTAAIALTLRFERFALGEVAPMIYFLRFESFLTSSKGSEDLSSIL